MLSVGCIQTVTCRHLLGAVGGAGGVGVPGVLLGVQGVGETEEAVPCPVRPASEHQSQAHVPHHTVNCAFLPPQGIYFPDPAWGQPLP